MKHLFNLLQRYFFRTTYKVNNVQTMWAAGDVVLHCNRFARNIKRIKQTERMGKYVGQ